MRRCVQLGFLCASLACAQIPDEGKSALSSLPAAPSSLGALTPSVGESREFINKAARTASAWNRSLPDFICIQTIRRDENRGERGWKASDTLTVQLGSQGGREYHKVTAINNRPTKASYESMKGAISEGEFGGTLSEIFRPGAAQFKWDSDVILRGRPVRVFAYDIDVSKSQFELRLPTLSWSKVVGHHGLVYIERETSQVLRVVQNAYIPADAPLRLSTETLDFDYADIGGRQFLLPMRAEVELATDNMRFRNQIDFHDYRKFSAESTLSFDDPGPGDEKNPDAAKSSEPRP